MKITHQISDSKTGLKREVKLVELVAGENEYRLQLELFYYVVNEGVKEYLPLSKFCKEFVTTNNRRMLPNSTGAISLFSDSDSGWDDAIPETTFYDYMLNSAQISLPDLIRASIINLDSAKWNWFGENNGLVV